MAGHFMKPGDLLAGRYRLDRPLGHGGFGVVFLATQLPLERQVAIKLLSPSGSGNSARFTQEAALAQRLDHPNTVRIVDFGFDPKGLPFIVWEFLRGQTLEQLIAASGPLPPATVKRIASQVLKSLMEAHGLGIVHRDVKPANLFITSHPGEPYFVKVLDFGIAKDTHALVQPQEARPGAKRTFVAVDMTVGTGATRASELIGTPRYMAPEQARGERVGPETDLFALGLVMSEMLSARKVFAQDNALELLLAQGSDDPTPIPAQVASGPLGGVIVRATLKDRTLRFRTAADMLVALDQLPLGESAAIATSRTTAAAGAPELTQPSPAWSFVTAPSPTPTAHFASSVAPRLPGSPPPTLRAPSRRRWLWPLATLLALGATVGAVAAVALSRAEPRAGDESEEEEEPDDPKPKKKTTNEKGTKPGQLLPMPKVDWTRARVPDYDLASLSKRLSSHGYELRKSQHSDMGTMTIEMITVSRPPCGGVVYFYRYNDRNDLESFAKSMVSTPSRRVVRTDNRFLMVALVRAEFPEGDPACTDPLAAALVD